VPVRLGPGAPKHRMPAGAAGLPFSHLHPDPIDAPWGAAYRLAQWCRFPTMLMRQQRQQYPGVESGCWPTN